MDDRQPTVDRPPQASGGAQFVTLILVMVVGTTGAKFGQWLAGPIAFWVFGSFASVVVALVSGLITRTFRMTDWPFFVFGPIGCLAGIQFFEFWLATQNEGSRQVLDFLGAICGVSAGGAVAVVIQQLLGTRRWW